MTKSIPRLSIVETLLNSLEAERHARVPLLLTVLDELSMHASLGAATERARELCTSLTERPVGDIEFVARIGELRGIVRELVERPRREPPPSQRTPLGAPSP